MANRHNVQKARGGGIGSRATMDAGGNPKVMSEAKERKRGGRAEYKCGGAVSGGRMDKRARGGRTGGADKSPFSSAGSGLRGG